MTPAGLFERLDAPPPGAGGLRIEIDASNPAKLAQVDIKALPGQTERWLAQLSGKGPADRLAQFGRRLIEEAPALARVAALQGRQPLRFLG